MILIKTLGRFREILVIPSLFLLGERVWKGKNISTDQANMTVAWMREMAVSYWKLGSVKKFLTPIITCQYND